MLQAISTQLRPSTCTAQMRQLPATESSGCQQKYGMSMPLRERRLHDGLVALGLDRLPFMKICRHSRFPSKRERLCSMKYSNSSRNLSRMPMVGVAGGIAHAADRVAVVQREIW